MLVLKAFIVKSELTSAVITQKIEQINISDKSNFDMAMEIHRLKGDLAKYHSLYAKAQNENHKLEEHIYRL